VNSEQYKLHIYISILMNQARLV